MIGLDVVETQLASAVAMVLLLAIHGCRPPATTRSRVPAIAPDSVPAWVEADSSRSSDRLFTKNIVVIFFTTRSTQRQRQAAVDLVNGTVIGGARVNSGEGYYYVQIPDDGTGAQLRAAIRKLEKLRQVEMASLSYRVLGQ